MSGNPSTPSAAEPAWGRLGIMWLAGASIRVTLLAVPPVLPLIHRDLQLDEKGVAAVSSLPILLMGAAATIGSLLVARFGPRRALIAGLLLIAGSSAMRGVGPSVPLLLASTTLMGAGISVCQPTFAALVRQWLPGRVPLATGFWSNGLLVGELAGAGLMLPLVMPLVGGSWELALTVSSAPVIVAAFLVALGTPHAGSEASYYRGAAWPRWTSSRLWMLGLFQASAGLIYFGANTFIPDYLNDRGQAHLVGPALTVLNAAQVPSSLVIALVPWRYLARQSSLVGLGLLLVAGLAGLASGAEIPLLIAAAIFGFGAACVLVAAFTLPAMVAAGADVSRLSAAMFTISYTLAFLANLLGGAIWDATHLAFTAFVPVILGTAIILVLGPAVMELQYGDR